MKTGMGRRPLLLTHAPTRIKCRVNLEVDVLAKYVERSMGATIAALREEVDALKAKVERLENQR